MFLSFYRYTEFFYTDECYKKSNELIASNLYKLERIKLRGRKLLNRCFNGTHSYMSRLIERLSTEFSINKEYLLLSTPEEICTKNIIHNEELLKERIENYCISSSEKLNLVTGEKCRQLQNIFCKKSDELKIFGTVANPGSVDGIARVIIANFNNYDKLDEILSTMKEGEILITETTSPDIVLACSKASGIVTNQGGLGSHAAVISRELGIPCIVGTGNATNVIKSGDRVRLDSSTNSVEIL